MGLVKWLEAHGESAELAKADIKRWTSWSATTGEYARKMAEEVAEREAGAARERKEKNAGNEESKK